MSEVTPRRKSPPYVLMGLVIALPAIAIAAPFNDPAMNIIAAAVTLASVVLCGGFVLRDLMPASRLGRWLDANW